LSTENLSKAGIRFATLDPRAGKNKERTAKARGGGANPSGKVLGAQFLREGRGRVSRKQRERGA